MHRSQFSRFMRDYRWQAGIALITCLLILVMLTLLAIAMFRGYGLQQKIAGNTREKERAYQAAESAVRYGEQWLMEGTSGTGVDCSTNANKASIVITTYADMRTCSNALTAPREPDKWLGYLQYTPPSMSVATTGGVVTVNSNKDINYQLQPSLYIAYLGLSADGQQMLYTVTGAGYGGSAGTTAVVQSVFGTTSKVKNLGNP